MSRLSRPTLVRSALTAAGTALALLALPGNATAREVGAASAPVRGHHCITDLPSGATQCVGTFREAMSLATGGIITDAPEQGGKVLSSPAWVARMEQAGQQLQRRYELEQVFAGASRGTSAGFRMGTPIGTGITLSIEFDLPDLDASGETQFFRGANGCDTLADVDYQLATLVGTGWDNRTSSYQGYNHCSTWHWSSANFSGVVCYGFFEEHMACDNATTSLQWK